MRITEAVESIIKAHPERSRSSIKRSFTDELKLGYTIPQTKARVERAIYAETIKVSSPAWTTPLPVSTQLPTERRYRANAHIRNYSDPTFATAAHAADCKTEECDKCEE